MGVTGARCQQVRCTIQRGRECKQFTLRLPLQLIRNEHRADIQQNHIKLESEPRIPINILDERHNYSRLLFPLYSSERLSRVTNGADGTAPRRSEREVASSHGGEKQGIGRYWPETLEPPMQ